MRSKVLVGGAAAGNGKYIFLLLSNSSTNILRCGGATGFAAPGTTPGKKVG